MQPVASHAAAAWPAMQPVADRTGRRASREET
jgi:hypothetical protein